MANLRYASTRIAYFTMEIGLESDLPTYSGGLGILAGDTIKAAADLRLPLVAMSLLHRDGYFIQHIDASGHQIEAPVHWKPEEHLRQLSGEAIVDIEGRRIRIVGWEYLVHGADGGVVPVVFLDTDVEGNDERDRKLTGQLYGGDHAHRLRQEIILGIGGIRFLRALGAHDVERYHMNEGHASLLTLELLREESDTRSMPTTEAGVLKALRRRCIFTTHTPVAAGHDVFGMDLVRGILDPAAVSRLDDLAKANELNISERLNMTELGLALSGFANAVAKRHGEVSRSMFPGRTIVPITNGIHVGTWAAPPMAKLFDQHLPGWRQDGSELRRAIDIPNDELVTAHAESRAALHELVANRTGSPADPEAFVIAFGRRATQYKRMDLLFADMDRLRAIADKFGPLLVVFAGKSHPADGGGKEIIRRVHETLRHLDGPLRGVYLPGYDMATCGVMIGGSDLWLNTPMPPMEASGTSGMKAALNGVPSLSSPDGWWIEGCLEGVTGWSIGPDRGELSFDEHALADPARRHHDADDLYDALEHKVLPLYRHNRHGWCDVMRHAIAINGVYFNTHRMMREYATRAYV